MLCYSVVCYRVSPRQKAEVVKMAQGNGRNVVLAIGDGANDVPMILVSFQKKFYIFDDLINKYLLSQEANVGVGIYGQEGLQAVRASDYSIPRFQFLKRLLFFYGACNFQRNAKVQLLNSVNNFLIFFSKIIKLCVIRFLGNFIFHLQKRFFLFIRSMVCTFFWILRSYIFRQFIFGIV